MPASRAGAQTVVTGLSRVSSASPISISSSSISSSASSSASSLSLSGGASPTSSLSSSPPTSVSSSSEYLSSYSPALPSLHTPTLDLTTVFPAQSPILSLPSLPVSLTDLSPSLSGTLITLPEASTRTLLVSAGKGNYGELNLRDAICDLLERADEEWGCTGVVLVLDKSEVDLGELIHSLLYVGGTVVSDKVWSCKEEKILVGLDL